MATTARNSIVRSVAPKSMFESAKNVLNSTNDWNQGDMLALASGVLKAVTATSDSANVCGVARQTIVDGKVKSPYSGTAVDASAAIEDIAGPAYGVIATLVAKMGDAFAPGALVYVEGTDAQRVTTTQPGTEPAIGIYQGPTIASAAAGQLVELLIGNNYGVTGPQF